MTRLVCYVLAASISLSTVAIVLVEMLFRMEVRPALVKNRTTAATFLDPYLGDVQFLARSPLFAPSRIGKNDAGTFLNPKVYWLPQPKTKPRGAAAPLVPLTIRETILRMRFEWMRKSARAANMKVDLSIFTGLGRFDYWDIEGDSPISDLAEQRVFAPPDQLPVPDVADLLAASKLRLMMGAVNGEQDYISALSDVRQLAQLLLTTENQQLMIAGLAALDVERAAYRYFVDEKNLVPSAWLPIDRNLLRRAHRAILATRGFLHLWTDPEILEKVYLKDQAPIGFCSAINEAMPIEFALRRRLEPQWPLEISLRREYAKLDAIYRKARAQCRLRYLGELVATNALRPPTPGPLVLKALPYSRKVFALRTSVLNFRGFNEYASAP